VTSVESGPAVEQSPAMGGQPDDRFLWRVPLFALACEITFAILMYLERVHAIWLLLGLLLLLLVVSAMIFAAGFGVVDVIRGRFKRAAALLLAPLIVALPFAFPILPFEYRGVEVLRLYLNKRHYDAAIEKLPAAERASKVVFFDWGATGSMLEPTDYSLVYDESGEIALPDAERSQAWKDRVYPQTHWVGDHCVTSAYRLAGHFYSMAARCS